MDDFMARHDDPVWARWTPPSGYQCRCRRIALTEAQAPRFIEADRKRLEKYPELAIARAQAEPDKGWDYSPCADPTAGLRRAIERKWQECLEAQLAAKRGGRKLWCQELLKRELNVLETALDNDRPMPEPRRLDLPLLQTGQNERFYLERFMRIFGEDWSGTALIEAPTRHSLSVSPLLFTDHKTGKTKIDKEGRAPYMLYIAETILQPDEIRLVTGSAGDRSLYFLGWYLIAGQKTAIIAVFKDHGKIWEGWSAYQTSNMIYVEAKRAYPLIHIAQKR